MFPDKTHKLLLELDFTYSVDEVGWVYRERNAPNGEGWTILAYVEEEHFPYVPYEQLFVTVDSDAFTSSEFWLPYNNLAPLTELLRERLDQLGYGVTARLRQIRLRALRAC